MFKTTSTNVKVKSKSKKITITYNHNFSKEGMSEFYIQNAYLSLDIERHSGDTPIDVLYKNKVIDRIVPKISLFNRTIINITEALNDVFKNQEDSLVLNINCTDQNYVEYYELLSSLHHRAVVEYIPYNLMDADAKSAYQTHDIKRAGIGSVNLFDGNLNFSHKDLSIKCNAINFDITHEYDSNILNNKSYAFTNNVLLPSLFMGKGWRLNIQQFLLQNSNYDFFEYIDGSGKHHTFKEKFYYINNGKKNYIDKKDVQVDALGNMSYTSGSTQYKVEKDIKSKTDMKIVSGEKGYKKRYFKSESEQIEQLREQVKQYSRAVTETNNNLSYNKKMACILAMSKLSMQIQHEIQNTNLTISDRQLFLQNYLKDVQRILLSMDQKNIKYSELVQQIVEKVIMEKLSEIKDGELDYNENLYKQLSHYKNKQEYQSFWDDVVDEDGNITELSIYNLQSAISTMNHSLIESLDRTRKYEALQILNAKEGETLKVSYSNEKNEILDDEEFSIAKNSENQINNEIERIKAQNELLNETLTDYKAKLDQSQHELDIMERQMPIMYISKPDGLVLGFGKIKDKSLYRLVMVSDKWDNRLMISYNEVDQIEKVIASNGDIFSLEYDTNKLTQIRDNRGRIIRYEYTANNLIKVIYPNGTATRFNYTEDKLVSAVEPSGYGVRYTYDGLRVNKIEEIAQLVSINHQVCIGEAFSDQKRNILLINYNQNKSTEIKNQKGVCLNYVFDEYGNVVNVTEYKAGQGQYVRTKSFDYDNDKIEYSIVPKTNSNEYLKNETIKKNINGVQTNYTAQLEYENHLNGAIDSVSIVAGDEMYPVQYVNAADNSNEDLIYTLEDSNNVLAQQRKIFISFSDRLISEIKSSGKKDFVFSAWAKADSLFINRKSLCYCGVHTSNVNEIADSEYLNNLDAPQKNRRFELCAKLKYKCGDEDKTETQYISFDWTKTDWQYLSLPVILSEDADMDLQGIDLIFDYSCNMGEAQIHGLSFKEGVWEYTEYNDGRKVYYENSDSEYISVYEYDLYNNLVKTILLDKPNYARKIRNLPYKSFDTNYSYNSQNALVRAVDYNGIVTENEYDENGIVIKSVKYHKDQPSNKFYDEAICDETGREIKGVNEFGEKICEYEYVTGTDIVSVVADNNSNQVAYGYDYNDDSLLNVSSSVDGEQNFNIIGYSLGLLTRLEHNGMQIDYTYNGYGELKSIDVNGVNYLSTIQEDTADGIKTTTSYANASSYQSLQDAEGNETLIKYNGNKIVEKEYDIYNKLLEVRYYSQNNDCIIEKLIYEDEQVVERQFSGRGLDFTIKASYDKEGNKSSTSIKYNNQNERRQIYNYDSCRPNSRLVNVELPNGVMQIPEYDKLGRLIEVKNSKRNKSFGKSIYYKQVGDHASNLVASEWFEKDGKIKDRLHYTYDEKGNIISIKENNGIIVRYAYDALSRLVREDNKKLDKTTVLTYDMGGNILSRTEYAYTLADIEKLTDGRVFTYEYNTTGWKDQLRSYDGIECGGYDPLGNPRAYRGSILTWSHCRQLDQISGVNQQIAKFAYNASGIRISKQIGTVKTEYYLDGTTILAQKCGNQTVYFNYGIDGIDGFTYNSKEYYYRKNIQGDILAILDENGTEIVQYVYDAWGNHNTYVLSDNNSYLDISKVTSNEYVTIAQLNPYRYRGYYYDVETGLYYLNKRYYDSEVGRFINADDISEIDTEKINGLNLYAYCLNNPVIYIDPYGDAFLSFLFGLLIAGLVGAAINTLGTLASDVVTSIFTGEWTFSSWETYLGSAIGGFVGGVVSIFNPYAGVVIGNTLSTFTGFAIGKATGSNTMSWGEIGIMTAVSFGVSLFVGGLSQYAKISGITKGSHSWQQIFKTGLTKSLRYPAYHMSMKTLAKGIGYLAVSGLTLGYLVNNFIQGLINRMLKIFV